MSTSKARRLTCAVMAPVMAILLAVGSASSARAESETGGQESDAALQAQAIVQGQTLVEKHCARCHAIGMRDTSPHKEAPPFREVVTRYPSEHLAEALAEGIQSGHPDMPVFIFEPPQIDAFLAFLDSLAPPDERDAPKAK